MYVLNRFTLVEDRSESGFIPFLETIAVHPKEKPLMQLMQKLQQTADSKLVKFSVQKAVYLGVDNP